MANINRLYIEADALLHCLQHNLIRSYRQNGLNWQTKKILAALDRAEYRKARRQKALQLECVSRATTGRTDSFSEMMESYRRGQI